MTNAVAWLHGVLLDPIRVATAVMPLTLAMRPVRSRKRAVALPLRRSPVAAMAGDIGSTLPSELVHREFKVADAISSGSGMPYGSEKGIFCGNLPCYLGCYLAKRARGIPSSVRCVMY